MVDKHIGDLIMRAPYPLVGSYNNQRVSEIDAERTINCFEFIDTKGKEKRVLIGTPGLTNKQFRFEDEAGGFLSSFVFKKNMYHVIGGKTFKIDQDEVVTNINADWSTVNSDVAVDANTYQILWVNGNIGWIYDTDVNLAVQITDSNFPSSPVDMTVLDNFFVVIQGGTLNFRVSELDNGLVWGLLSDSFTVNTSSNIVTVASSLNYANLTPVTVSSSGSLPGGLSVNDTYFVARISNTTFRLATSKQDVVDILNGDTSKAVNITSTGSGTHTITNNGELQEGSVTTDAGTLVACQVLHRNLFFFTENYTEVWNNQGVGDNLPFRRINSLLIQYGCAARKSVTVGFDRLYFLSRQEDGLGAVMEIRGTQPVPISNLALDYQMAQWDADQSVDISDAVGDVLKVNGLIFYRLNFISANSTFVYNGTLSTFEQPLWHEEMMLDGSLHVISTHAYFNGLNYVGHRTKPILYLFDEDESTNDGEVIERTRIGQPIYPETGNRLQIDRFTVDLLQGERYSTITETDIFTEDSDSILAEDGDTLIIESVTDVLKSNHPVIYLSISKDGGQSYGYQISKPMGKTGERTFRTVWRKLGRTKRTQAFVPRIQFYENFKFVLLGAVWDYQELPE